VKRYHSRTRAIVRGPANAIRHMQAVYVYRCILFRPQNTLNALKVETTYMITREGKFMTVKKGYGNDPLIEAQCSTQTE
jgi:hypothetical protein